VTYANIVLGEFLSRPNRFIAEVEIDGAIERCHVKNTGRCKELLVPDAGVYVQKCDNPHRKTQFDLVSVQKGARFINMDSQAPNAVFYEFLHRGKFITGLTKIKPEAVHGDSRFDFYCEAEERKIFIEVKGVTLEENGVVLFPDAPTLRGLKHVNELARCAEAGYEAHIVFVVQMADVLFFTPNNATQPAFGAALISAREAGVQIAAFDCAVTPDSLTISKAVEVRLNSSAPTQSPVLSALLAL
jgi:sugar fermentation stimulation protein A